MGDFVKRFGSRVVFGLLGAGALIGYKFYQRGQSHDEVKAELVKICEEDAACQAAVNAHFDACHEEAFRLGGRRSSAELDTGALTRCINTAAGDDIFSVE
jgi:hypothetical protein